MSLKKDDSDIPVPKSSEKKSFLAKDEQIKGFWNNLVNDWLKNRAKHKEEDKSED